MTRKIEVYDMEEKGKKQVIDKTKELVQTRLKDEPTGHDWWHAYLVWRNALYIGKLEKVDLFVVQLAALLHDIADYKFNNGDEAVGIKFTDEWLSSLGVDTGTIDHVCEIIRDIPFKGINDKSKMRTKEGMVVQDADRLESLGAIGIARTFAYGGYKHRIIYDPNVQSDEHDSFDKVKKNLSPSINHFYEKLLLLKELMNTSAGRIIAERRHAYMIDFLEEFFAEWDGKDVLDSNGEYNEIKLIG